MKLAFGNTVSPEFRDRMLAIVRGFGWSGEHASWLMACMAFESAGTFSPSITNAAGSGATGLIQFMPKTALGLGTTVEKLAGMTAVEQLHWVERYFKPYAKRINSLTDMYMAILLPGAIGKPDDHPLFSSGVAYRQNAALDSNNDGTITKAEATGRVAATLWKGLQPPNVYEVQSKEPDMPIPAIASAILSTILPALTARVPELATILRAPGAAENPEVLERVSAVLVNATGSTNVQEAVERVQADPQTAAEVNDALRSNRAEVMDMLERMAVIEDKRVESAREYNRGEPLILDTPALKLKFVHVVSLIFILLGGAAAIGVLLTSQEPSERAMALQTLLLVGFAGVAQFWIGSSRSSQIKDEVRGNQ